MANCSQPPTGIAPLCDLGPNYQTYPTGLYVGSNQPIATHVSDYRRAALSVEPLNAVGAPDPQGKIGFASIGFSYGNLISAKFVLPEGTRPEVEFANLCYPGQDATDLSTLGWYWNVHIPSVLGLAGLDARQVQVIWLTSGVPIPSGVFPFNAQSLRALLVLVIQNAKIVFPNLRVAYIESPGYNGYSSIGSNEPWNFEQGFAFQWLIDDQAHRRDPALAPSVAPILMWGLYLWVDGATPRNYDGLDCICPTDLYVDGHHPSHKGAKKIADFLTARFHADPYARAWLSGIGTQVPQPPSPTQTAGG